MGAGSRFECACQERAAAQRIRPWWRAVTSGPVERVAEHGVRHEGGHVDAREREERREAPSRRVACQRHARDGTTTPPNGLGDEEDTCVAAGRWPCRARGVRHAVAALAGAHVGDEARERSVLTDPSSVCTRMPECSQPEKSTAGYL